MQLKATYPKLYLIVFTLFPSLLLAQQNIVIEEDSMMLRGQTNYSSDFFRDRLLHNTMESFLDNYNDFLIYQTTTHGDFNTPDQTVISIQGNSYRWNKYYLDGFRMDNRIRPGSYLYNQDLYSNSFNIDTYNSAFHFTKDKSIQNAALLRYNVGSIGGISPGTEWFFNLFHPTALQTTFKPINYRRNVRGQGVMMLDYNIKHKGQELHQHLYVDYGQRELVAFDYSAENNPFYENYFKSELSGALPTNENGFFSSLNYALAFSFRDQFNHEFYYGQNETAQDNKYSSSIYGSKLGKGSKLTTGLTFALHSTIHNDLNFSRNHMDIDGESLNPYAPDANTSEISHALNYKKTLTKQLSLSLETYNSLIHSKATTEAYSNSVYYESLVSPIDQSWREEDDPFYTSLYIYDWKSRSFSTGLLENSIGFSYEKDLSPKLKFQSHINATLDGILLNDKSIVRANWEADFFLNWKPNPHFSTSINAGRKRVAFHYDMAKYLSNDYLDRDIYYWQDDNNDKIYQAAEKSDFLTSTGGSYRTMSDGLQQPAYFFVDWPLIVSVAKKHTFTLVTTYKKFYTQWQSVYSESPEDYGYYQNSQGVEAFFLNQGQQVNYVINSDNPQGLQLNQPAELMTNTPFSFTNIMKYSYNGEKAFFSLSWVSQFMMNVTDLGNSPQENNIEMFSDISANPNTHINQAGRPQQDRGYIARILYGYKFNEHWKSSFLFKFVDGQPFSKYKTTLSTDDKGNTQIATWRGMPNSTSPLYEEWGDREDMGFNTELRISYTAHLERSSIEFNISGYNLIDFGYELISNGYDLPTEYRRRSIEICAPRGLMFTSKVSF